MSKSTSVKIVSREKLLSILTDFKAKKKIIGYTSGAFDILHAGHVEYLEEARSLCDLLVVGVNSNTSIKQYKDEKRPVRDESERTRVIAALSCVDYVFTFSERNNNKNIETLKPDIYFKAQDYDKTQLSSAPIIEAYGGQVKLIPMLPGFSTTSIIEDIIFRFSPSNTTSSQVERSKEKQKAVFLDRDGTINEQVQYLSEPTKFKLIEGAAEALKRFQEHGYKIVVVTNQPGIGMGYFNKEDYFLVNKELLKEATKVGVSIDRIYFCPHSKADKCKCRKPGTEMIERAVADLNIDTSKSYVIGDSTLDIMLAKNCGCRSILVKTGHAGEDGNFDVKPDFVAADLKAASEIVVAK